MKPSTPSFTTDVVIGLEIHVQLDTKTKLFCSCPTKPVATKQNAEDVPNTRCCPTCLGFPGSKPVANKKAIDYALKLCLALGCSISETLVFSRKSYFYPDLSKNYQITQYELPLGTSGAVMLSTGKKIGLTRVHLEEDPASLVHPDSIERSAFVLIDYNRSGIPLCEIVTNPELASPEEARDFMKQLNAIFEYLDIFNADTCVVKADANISIKESGYIRSEVKNITGFKEIERALFYEVQRQNAAVAAGEKLVQDTRGWDAAKGITIRLRKKETEEDYGYILDTDIPVIDVTPEWIAQIKKQVPELPAEKVHKFVTTHKIPEEDALVLAQEKLLAEMFEKVAEKIDPILAAKWLRRELLRVMNMTKQTFKDLLIDEHHLIELLELVSTKQITDRTAQKMLEELIVKPFSPKAYVKEHGLGAVSDAGIIEQYCKEAIAENPGVLADYKSGNEKAFHFLVGVVMKKSKGKAVPNEVNSILKSLISH
ncbi:MAG: Asp-tRNA(Asn)/Glu-tRNA(Gln) amidotransferase subunit GatB [Candidatus Woesearchaeota archaeon]|nr:Asp-tRNA(Asn)/Glu-tRNA(Gln) amidotransferase subunit GatB [Candidatus Woesearchaeota archaeon]